MKKGFFVLSAFFGSLMLSAGIPEGYKEPEEKSEVLFSDDFSGGLDNWKIWRGRQVFKIVPGTGDNGSPGLVYERPKPDKSYGLLHYWFKGVPGKRYCATLCLQPLQRAGRDPKFADPGSGRPCDPAGMFPGSVDCPLLGDIAGQRRKVTARDPRRIDSLQIEVPPAGFQRDQIQLELNFSFHSFSPCQCFPGL